MSTDLQKLITIEFNEGDKLSFVDKCAYEVGHYSPASEVGGEIVSTLVASHYPAWPCLAVSDLIKEDDQVPVMILVENKYPNAPEFVGLHRSDLAQKCIKHGFSFRVVYENGSPTKTLSTVRNAVDGRVSVWLLDDFVYRAEWW